MTPPEPPQGPSRVTNKEYVRRLEVWARMEALRECSIAEGMTLLNEEEVIAEARPRRGSEASFNPTLYQSPEDEQVLRRTFVEKLRAIREEAVQSGLELRDLDRVNAEVQDIRYGDRKESPYNEAVTPIQKPIESEPGLVPAEEYARRLAALDRMEAIRDRAIANGLELWSWERFEEEMRLRFGDDEE